MQHEARGESRRSQNGKELREKGITGPKRQRAGWGSRRVFQQLTAVTQARMDAEVELCEKKPWAETLRVQHTNA